MMRKILIIALLMALAGGTIAYKMYNKPHKNMLKARADVTLSADKLFLAYELDETAADGQYLGKIIQVTGEVNRIDLKEDKVFGLGLETGDLLAGMTCLLDETYDQHRQDFNVGEKITLRCICTGKLMDIELNRCVEIK